MVSVTCRPTWKWHKSWSLMKTFFYKLSVCSTVLSVHSTVIHFECDIVTCVLMMVMLNHMRRTSTLSPPIPLRLYTLPYWYNPPFLIFDIWAIWPSGLSARVPHCQKLFYTRQSCPLISAIQLHSHSFLPKCDYVTFGSLLSQICLSSVKFVHPTLGVETFCIFLCHFVP